MRLSPLIAAAAFLAIAAPALAQEADPFSWLENIHDARALDWVAGQNARTAGRLEADPRYETFRKQALAIFTAKDRIPYPGFLGDGLDNLWQDETHTKGLWRRTTLASYRTKAPAWETLIDLDALSKAEGKTWIWKGANCLEPEERFCLVSLSNGGGDSVEVREFDTKTKTFVTGGFHFDNGKQFATWLDRDTLILTRDFGPGTMTRSGYGFVVKTLKRGQPLSAATEVFRGEESDGGGARAQVLKSPAGALDGVVLERSVTDYNVEYALLTPKGPSRIDLPRKSRLAAYVNGWLTFTIQEDWKGKKAGALMAYRLADLKRDPMRASPALILAPGPRQTIDRVEGTRTHLLVQMLEDVKGKVEVYDTIKPGWTHRTLALPAYSSLLVRAASSGSERAFVSSESFLEANALFAVDAGTGKVEKLKALPPRFDASKDVVEQHFATSSDGTKIPYFLVRPKGIKLDGTTPVQMYGYGGFLISKPPVYWPEMGKLWLERGGAHVIANIRGGGEFGPAWHDAVLREKRQLAFDDFAAVARDLIARKVTSPRRLGIYGRSNGGVLTSVSITQHPELFNAAVIESPLVDMLRYSHLSAGASWIGEYGDPDVPADRAFIEAYSAYQKLAPGVKYPEPYITTNTEDDRVHPGHARKLAAKLESLGDPCLYYENTFGGHANDADPELNARRWARHYVYLTQKLMD